MEQVGEFFLVTAVGVRACGPHDAQACLFEPADDIVRRSFSLGAELSDQLTANLFDFGGGITRLAKALPNFQDHRFLGGPSPFLIRVSTRRTHQGPRCAACFWSGTG